MFPQSPLFETLVFFLLFFFFFSWSSFQNSIISLSVLSINPFLENICFLCSVFVFVPLFLLNVWFCLSNKLSQHALFQTQLALMLAVLFILLFLFLFSGFMFQFFLCKSVLFWGMFSFCFRFVCFFLSFMFLFVFFACAVCFHFNVLLYVCVVFFFFNTTRLGGSIFCILWSGFFCLLCFKLLSFLFQSKQKDKKRTWQKHPSPPSPPPKKKNMQKNTPSCFQLAQLCSQIVFLIFWGGLNNSNLCCKHYNNSGFSILCNNPKWPKSVK